MPAAMPLGRLMLRRHGYIHALSRSKPSLILTYSAAMARRSGSGETWFAPSNGRSNMATSAKAMMAAAVDRLRATIWLRAIQVRHGHRNLGQQCKQEYCDPPRAIVWGVHQHQPCAAGCTDPLHCVEQRRLHGGAGSNARLLGSRRAKQGKQSRIGVIGAMADGPLVPLIIDH